MTSVSCRQCGAPVTRRLYCSKAVMQRSGMPPSVSSPRHVRTPLRHMAQAATQAHHHMSTLWAHSHGSTPHSQVLLKGLLVQGGTQDCTPRTSPTDGLGTSPAAASGCVHRPEKPTTTDTCRARHIHMEIRSMQSMQNLVHHLQHRCNVFADMPDSSPTTYAASGKRQTPRP